MQTYEGNQRTLGAILAEKARVHQDKVFAICEDQQISYRYLDETSNRVGNGFLKLGAKKGEKVAIMLPNCLEFLYVWFGLAKIGVVEVPVNSHYKGDFLRYILADCDASFVLADEQFVPLLEPLQDELKNVRALIIVASEPSGERSPRPKSLKCVDFDELLDSPASPPEVTVGYTDTVSIMYTSGTTGASKGIVLAHNHDYLMGIWLAEFARLTANDVYYTPLPYFHGISQFMVTVPALLADAKLAVAKRFSASRFWDDIRKYGATATFFVGTIPLVLYQQAPKEDDADNPLRVCFAAPAPPPGTYEDFERRFGVKLVQLFGSTETSVAIISDYDNPKIGSCGKVSPYFEVKLVDDNDEEVPPNHTGEFVVRPKEPYSGIVEYYKKPAETAQAFRNLWYHSGDLGHFDDEGYFYFDGRKKDAIRRGGENISAEELENVVGQHPAVEECAAIGVPSEVGEEEVKIVVVLKTGQKVSAGELVSFCEERLPYFAVPRYVEFKDGLPKTATEKVKKVELRDEGVTAATWDRKKAA